MAFPFEYVPITLPSGISAFSLKCNVPIPSEATCRMVYYDESYHIYPEGVDAGHPAKIPQELVEEWRTLEAKFSAINEWIADLEREGKA
jgi:hypothetical protein